MSAQVEAAHKLVEKFQEEFDTGNFENAVSYGQQALALLEEVEETDPQKVSTGHMMMALGYFRHEKDYAKSITAYEKMFDVIEEDPEDLLEVICNFTVDFYKADKIEMVAHWFDRVADLYKKQTFIANQALAAKAYKEKFFMVYEDKETSEEALATLDALYEAALLDPYGYLISGESQEINCFYRQAGQSQRALAFVDRAITSLSEKYSSSEPPLGPEDENDPNDGFMGDRFRFQDYQGLLKEKGLTPRPIVTLQAERALLLLDIEGRDQDAMDACTVVVDAQEADAQGQAEAKNEDTGEIEGLPEGLPAGLFDELSEALGANVSITPMGAGSTTDLYEPEFQYALGEATRRIHGPQKARPILEEANDMTDPEDDPELSAAIREALGKC